MQPSVSADSHFLNCYQLCLHNLQSSANSWASSLASFRHLLVRSLNPPPPVFSPSLTLNTFPCPTCSLSSGVIAFLPRHAPLTLHFFCDLSLKAALESFPSQSPPLSPEFPHLGLPDSHIPLSHLLPSLPSAVPPPTNLCLILGLLCTACPHCTFTKIDNVVL